MKKMKILHLSNTYNYGTAMMGINFLNYLSENLTQKIECECDFSCKEDYERIINEIKNLKNIVLSSKTFLNVNNSIIKKITNKFKGIINAFREKSDYIVILGGDDLSEYYESWRISFKLIELYIMSKRKKVFLVGQTIGKFYSWRIPLAKYCLKNCYIYSRDKNCTKYLNDIIKLNNINQSSDLAFLDLPLQRQYIDNNNLLEKYKLEKDKYICIIPSGLSSKYTTNYQNYLNSYILIVKTIYNIFRSKSVKILLLPHVLKPSCVDDRKIIKYIKDNLTDNIKNNILFIENELSTTETRIILSNGLFTLTGRMHGAVSTFQMKKPALCLSYSIKYAGVIGGLGFNDLIIEANDDKIWNENTIISLILEKINYLLKNYDSIITRIDTQIKNEKILSLKQIKDIAEIINNKG